MNLLMQTHRERSWWECWAKVPLGWPWYIFSQSVITIHDRTENLHTHTKQNVTRNSRVQASLRRIPPLSSSDAELGVSWETQAGSAFSQSGETLLPIKLSYNKTAASVRKCSAASDRKPLWTTLRLRKCLLTSWQPTSGPLFCGGPGSASRVSWLGPQETSSDHKAASTAPSITTRHISPETERGLSLHCVSC